MGSSTLPGDLAELGPAARICVLPEDGVDLQKWGEQGLDLIPPMWLLNYIANIVSCHVSILFNAQGPSNTITQSDVGGLLALGEAFRTIQGGKADVTLVGGSDTKITPIFMTRFPLFFQLSQRNDSPETACRPFDRDRDGMVLSEGAGILVLEELEHARRRGARIYAEVAGFAAAFDRQRNGQGLARAVQTALHESGLDVADLDHVNAQGYSTRREDVWEAQGLHDVLKESNRTIPALAVKSYLGSLGAAAGPVELAASLLALQDGMLPATLNHEHPDPECPIAVNRELRPVERLAALKINFTEMGQCGAVVIRQPEERAS
jgi:3-oxoacyl-[acyl-carrier-protein] synthase II